MIKYLQSENRGEDRKLRNQVQDIKNRPVKPEGVADKRDIFSNMMNRSARIKQL